ncbi:DUF7257 domain-containing protein [Mycobacterium sp. TJFP1]
MARLQPGGTAGMIADTYPAKRYPANPLTPQGARHLLEGRHPVIRLRSPDDSVLLELFGGASIPDWGLSPECVQLQKPPEDLIAGWRFIDQQSANEDGVRNLGVVNEAVEIKLPIVVHARNGIELRKMLNTLFGSLDPERTGTFSWWTPEFGYWYGAVRWFKPPREPVAISGDECTAETTIAVRIDGGFFRGLDDVAQFRFAYDEMRDDFDVDYAEDRNLGPNWPIRYFGQGGGYVFAGKGQARWRDDPNRRIGTEGRTFVAGPYRDFETETDYQVLEFQLGNMLEFGAADDGWVRKGRLANGDWNGYGTRIRVTGGSIQLSAFNNYHETPVETWGIFPPPLPGEFIRVEAGDPDANDGAGDPRIFRVKRGLIKASITTFKTRDDAGITPLGANFRGVGFGGHASAAWIGQGTPATLTHISAGDASVVTQTGVIPRLNIGTVARWDRYTLYGPGTFEIAAGPGSTQMVKFGPLLPNQIVRLNSDGSGKRVFDATQVPATAEELLEYREMLDELKDLAPLGNEETVTQAIASAYGVVPPQGNLHQLLEGWFTRPIPAKPSGLPAQEVNVAVSISGGNSNSRIIAHGTPLARWPQ